MQSLQLGDEDAWLAASQLRDEDSRLTAPVGKPVLHCVGVSAADLCHQPSITYRAGSGRKGEGGWLWFGSSRAVAMLSLISALLSKPWR